MLIVKRAASTTPGSAPTRPALAQSTATSTRSPKSAGRVLHETALLELEEPVLARQGRRPTEEHHDVLAELAKREAHPQERPQRVAVGSLVRGDEEAIVLAEGGRNRLHVSLGRHLPPGERARR